MKKFFFIIALFIASICGCAILAYVYAAPILAKLSSIKTQTLVTICHIDFKSSSFTISDLQINNTKEARAPIALKVKTITVQAPYKQYMQNPIVIEQICLDEVYIDIELYNEDQSAGNWQTILKNMQEKYTISFLPEKVAIIKKLILTNIRVDLTLSDGQLHRLDPIDRLEFDDLHSKKGIPFQEISDIITEQMINSIFIVKGLKAIVRTPIFIIKKLLPFL